MIDASLKNGHSLRGSKYWRIGVYIFILVSLILVFVIGTTLILTIDLLLKSEYSHAGSVVAISSVASTMLLVLLTGYYAYNTRELVNQAEKDREHERELRRNDQLEEWYNNLLYHLRMIQNVWDRGFAQPDGTTAGGEVYVSLESNQELWQDLGSHFENIPSIVSRQPPHVDQDIVEEAKDLHRRWVMMTHIDIGSEREDPRVLQSNPLFEDVTNIEDDIDDRLPLEPEQ